MTVGDNVGKDPRVTDQFLIGNAGKHRDWECDLRERVKEIAILNQRHAAIVEILALVDTARVHGSVDANHEVEWQGELDTVFGKLPEDPVTERGAIVRRRLLV